MKGRGCDVPGGLTLPPAARSNMEKIMSTATTDIIQADWLAHQLRRARTHGVVSERCILTPAMAAALLERNPDNRTIKQVTLDKMIRDIAAGHWAFNGEPIIIADTGELNDGQHRAIAVVKTQMSIETMITIGVPRSTRTTVDRGVARTPGDLLGMHEIKNGATTAAAARVACQHETLGRVTGDPRLEPTTQEIIDYVLANPRLVELASRYCGGSSTRLPAPPSTFVAMHFVLEKVNATDAEQFMTDVATGHMIDAQSPAGLLRARLMDKSRRLRRPETCELFVRAWNAYRDRRPFTRLPLIGNFPEII